jgi:hypothetical protein
MLKVTKDKASRHSALFFQTYFKSSNAFVPSFHWTRVILPTPSTVNFNLETTTLEFSIYPVSTDANTELAYIQYLRPS